MSAKTLSRRALLAWLGSLGAPALALEPLLAKNAPAGVDPKPYLASEKLDGVRALRRPDSSPRCRRRRWTASCGWGDAASTSFPAR